MGSSAARDTELSMMKTKMRLVKIWWLMSLWQNTRNLGRNRTKESVSRRGGTSVIIAPCLGDSRVGATEDEKGASCWDGRNLLFDGEFRQPLRARPWWDFWEVLIILLLFIIMRN